jgi:hypothetical protein
MPSLSHETAQRLGPAHVTSRWLPARRLRAHAIVLALCLWGTCAVDFATPGSFDRAGNIKFQDFLQFYISARLVREHRAAELYNQQVADQQLHAIVAQPTLVRLPTVYGPQVGFLFVPLSRFSFLNAAALWVAFSLLMYFGSLCALWRCCPALRPHAQLIAIAAAAFPPLFHFFVRGQISALLLALMIAAFLAFRANRLVLAGVALGCLVLKPQFLVAIPLVLLFARAWKPLAGLLLSAATQLAAARLYFGSGVMNAYIDTMRHASRWINLSELPLAPVQMHSLRAFWSLLVPSHSQALILFVLSSIPVLWMTTSIWKSRSTLDLRFSALLLAAVLISPHLFIYDLLVLAPIFLLLANWILANDKQPKSSKLGVLLYLAFMLPLFGPLARWTHLQLSVPVFVAILWTLFRVTTRSGQLASSESVVV